MSRHQLTAPAYMRRRETLMNVYYRWNHIYCDFLDRFGKNASCSRHAYEQVIRTIEELEHLQLERLASAMNEEIAS